MGNEIALRLPQKGPVPSRFVHTVACAPCAEGARASCSVFEEYHGSQLAVTLAMADKQDASTNQTKDLGTIFGFDLGFLKIDLKKRGA